jgi:hypothetical protein
MATRKPKSKEPADVVLNKFLQKNGILLATKQLQISQSTDGSVTIRGSQPTAIYKEDIPVTPGAQGAPGVKPVASKNGPAKK